MKISHNIFCLIAIWTVGLLFWTSQSVQKAERELRSLKQSSYSEMEMVRVLSSEWDYLNRPERLEQLAKEYLTIEHIGTEKILTSVDLLEKTPVVPDVENSSPKVVRVSTKKNKNKPVLKKQEKTQDIIRKHDQDNFQSMMDNLSMEGE